eukprot:gene1642-3181_t
MADSKLRNMGRSSSFQDSQRQINSLLDRLVNHSDEETFRLQLLSMTAVTSNLLGTFEHNLIDMQESFSLIMDGFKRQTIGQEEIEAIFQAEHKRGFVTLQLADEVKSFLEIIYNMFNESILELKQGKGDNGAFLSRVDSIFQVLDQAMETVVGISRVATVAPANVTRAINLAALEKAELKESPERGYFAQKKLSEVLSAAPILTVMESNKLNNDVWNNNDDDNDDDNSHSPVYKQHPLDNNHNSRTTQKRSSSTGRKSFTVESKYSGQGSVQRSLETSGKGSGSRADSEWDEFKSSLGKGKDNSKGTSKHPNFNQASSSSSSGVMENKVDSSCQTMKLKLNSTFSTNKVISFQLLPDIAAQQINNESKKTSVVQSSSSSLTKKQSFATTKFTDVVKDVIDSANKVTANKSSSKKKLSIGSQEMAIALRGLQESQPRDPSSSSSTSNPTGSIPDANDRAGVVGEDRGGVSLQDEQSTSSSNKMEEIVMGNVCKKPKLEPLVTDDSGSDVQLKSNVSIRAFTISIETQTDLSVSPGDIDIPFPPPLIHPPEIEIESLGIQNMVRSVTAAGTTNVLPLLPQQRSSTTSTPVMDGKCLLRITTLIASYLTNSRSSSNNNNNNNNNNHVPINEMNDGNASKGTEKDQVTTTNHKSIVSSTSVSKPTTETIKPSVSTPSSNNMSVANSSTVSVSVRVSASAESSQGLVESTTGDTGRDSNATGGHGPGLGSVVKSDINTDSITKISSMLTKSTSCSGLLNNSTATIPSTSTTTATPSDTIIDMHQCLSRSDDPLLLLYETYSSSLPDIAKCRLLSAAAGGTSSSSLSSSSLYLAKIFAPIGDEMTSLRDDIGDMALQLERCDALLVTQIHGKDKANDKGHGKSLDHGHDMSPSMLHRVSEEIGAITAASTRLHVLATEYKSVFDNVLSSDLSRVPKLLQSSEEFQKSHQRFLDCDNALAKFNTKLKELQIKTRSLNSSETSVVTQLQPLREAPKKIDDNRDQILQITAYLRALENRLAEAKNEIAQLYEEIFELQQRHDRTPGALLFFACLHSNDCVSGLQQLVLQLTHLKVFVDASDHVDFLTLRKRLQVCVTCVPAIHRLVTRYLALHAKWTKDRYHFFDQIRHSRGDINVSTICPLCCVDGREVSSSLMKGSISGNSSSCVSGTSTTTTTASISSSSSSSSSCKQGMSMVGEGSSSLASHNNSPNKHQKHITKGGNGSGSGDAVLKHSQSTISTSSTTVQRTAQTQSQNGKGSNASPSRLLPILKK